MTHRHRRRRSLGNVFFSLGSVGLFLAAVLLVTGLFERHVTGEFLQQGVQATAVVDRTYRSGKSRSSYVAYHYSDSAGLRHQGNDAYPFADWGTLRPGQAIGVLYLRNEPGNSRVARRQEMLAGRDSGYVYRLCAIPAGMGIALLALGSFMRRREGQG